MNEIAPQRPSEQSYLFVSYAHADAAIVMSDLVVLGVEGINCWHDEAIPGGAQWREEVARRLAASSGVLCFLSKNSARSAHCVSEITFAIDEGKPLICVYLEAFTLPAGLRMSLSPRQGLYRYSIPAIADYHEKLVRAALSAAAPSTPVTEIPPTRLLPDALVLEYGDRQNVIPANFSGRFSIGRDRDCQLRIDSDFISRHHGYVKVHRGTFQYCDQSRNGSLLKTSSIEQLVHRTEVTLPEAGQLNIGDVTISFEVIRSGDPVDGSA